MSRKLWIFPIVMQLAAGCVTADSGSTMRALEGLAASDSKPFVVVGSTVSNTVDKGQGVLISTRGHVLSVGHLNWCESKGCYSEKFNVSLRTTDNVKVPEGYTHDHRTLFSDKEGTAFREFRYPAKLIKHEGSRFLDNKDLSVFKAEAKTPFPKMDFYSEDKPEINVGDVLYLCHYIWPTKNAEPTFIINGITIVGVVQTSSGMQYLARGYTRWGSSGGAILKDGRLIGIQSAAYTINAPEIGEVPSGMTSFHLVWRSMFDDYLGENDKR